MAPGGGVPMAPGKKPVRRSKCGPQPGAGGPLEGGFRLLRPAWWPLAPACEAAEAVDPLAKAITIVLVRIAAAKAATVVLMVNTPDVDRPGRV
jgi:hypothetical protein